ncbi:MAG: hypothetical protein WA040_02535 [Anaerolineae bacterium]
MGEKVTITPRQTLAIASLLASGKVADAAKAADVAPKTVYAWLNQPAFQAALSDAAAHALRALARRLAGLGDAAADALKDALQDGQPIAVRLRAAALVTERTPALVQLVDLADRIERLEALLADETQP